MPSPYLRKAPAFRTLLSLFALAVSAHAEVVINEIMYRPGIGYPENTGLEFIELLNPDATEADISGWSFTAGIGYTFPANTVIPPGGFLVVASDPAAVAAAHNISGVYGPWNASSGLSNNGEKIELGKPGLPVGTWIEVDKVSYSSEGDWGNRAFVSTAVGMDWVTPANPSSLTVTANTNDTLTTASPHGLLVGDRVRFLSTNTLPAPLVAGTTYFVRSTASTTTLTLAAAAGDPVVDLTTAGSGTQSIYFEAKSLELQNPALDNDQGQNWTTSISPTGGTPGAANSAISTNIAPIITGVKHFPAVPRSNQAVTVSCQIQDEGPLAGLTATLHWRLANATTPPAFQTIAMTGDGTGLFSAPLDVQNNLTKVEFYVSASDGTKTRTWPAPTNQGQTANCQYQVDNENSNTGDSFYRLVLTEQQNAAYNSASSNSDQRFNATLIVSRGADTAIRYLCDIRSRGNSSRSHTIGGAKAAPIRLRIPIDNPLDNGSSFDINPRSSFLQYLGLRMFQAVGLAGPDSIPIEFRRNAVELTSSTGNLADYGKWVLVQAFNGDFLDRAYPNGGGGQLYKKTDNSTSANFYWRSVGWTLPNNPDGNIDFWTKENNSGANDWSDLTNFFQVWQTAAAPHFSAAAVGDVAEGNGSRLTSVGKWNTANPAFTPAELASVDTVSDLTQWAKFFAITTILMDLETKVSNGVDDDYSIYFVPGPNGTRRANFLPHDLDAILGQGDSGGSFNTKGLYDATADGELFRTLLPLLGTAGTPGNAQFRTLYFNTIREFYGTVFNADTSTNPNPAFHAFLDNHLTGWAPATRIAAIKTFATQRQAYLLGQIGAGTTPIVPPAGTSTPTLVSAPPNTLMISEVLARNTTAHQNGATFPDVIELYNAGGTERDLTGMSLSDDPAIPAKFPIPAGTIIPANAYLVIYADSETGAPGLHTGFGLNQDGDQLRLYGPTGSGGQPVLDTVTFGPQAANFSIGRTGPARDTWALCTPTVGATNTPVAALGSPGGVVINEWLSNPGFRFDDDFLELYNPAVTPVALAGMKLTDDFINDPAAYVIPPLTFIGPGDFVTFFGIGDEAAAAIELPFKISSASGWLALIGVNGTIVDRVDIISQPEDGSTARVTNGSPLTTLNYLPPGSTTPGTRIPTPGAANSAPPNSYLALLQYLRVTEISYNPQVNPDAEYLEFANLGPVVLDLAGVRIANGIDFVFPQQSLAPGARVLVVRNATLMRSLYGNNLNIIGEFTGRLDNNGENIEVLLPAPYDAAIVGFRYQSTWYPTTAGGGYTLELGDTDSDPRNDDESTNWRASTATGGSPSTVAGPPVISSSLTTTGALTVAFSYQITSTNQPYTYGLTGSLPAGLVFNANTGLISGTPTASGTFNVNVAATNILGTDTKALSIQIFTVPPPIISSTSTANALLGDAFNYQIVASNNPTAYGATGLPSWLSLNTTTGQLTGTASAAGQSSILLSATNGGGTGTLTLNLTVASSGPHTGYTWSTIPSPRTINTPISATLRATDVQGRTVTSYNGTANLTGQSAGTSQGLILITECGTGGFDYFEIQNVGNATLNTAGWFIVPNRGNTGGGVNVTHSAWMLPPTMAAGEVIAIFDSSTEYPESISWGSFGDPVLDGWCMLCNGAGAVQDFVAWGYTREDLDEVNFDITAGETPYTHITVPASVWSGDGAALPTGFQAGRVVRYRQGSTDANDASNWFNRNEQGGGGGGGNRANPGTQNAGLTVPFFPAPPPIAITPTSATFTNGVWTGSFSVPEIQTGMRVVGTDTSSRTGSSNTFDVLNLGAPVINSPTTALAVVNQTFSFQLTANAPVATWSATGLPASLVLNPTTGVIAGTPTTSTAINLNVTANNPNGTGIGTLAITVGTDTDGDGAPNTWETANGLSATSGADAKGDRDGDGVSNLQEYLAGTNPNDRDSRFVISSFAIVGNNVTLEWKAVSARRYRVWTTTALGTAWTSLNANPLPGVAGTMSYTHVDGALTAPRFYRVEVMQ